MDVDMAMDYLTFVEERHRIWEQRQAGDPQPWTDDPILATRKFTNVFRVLDPGSQFVLTDLLPDTEPEEFLLRCFLYRHTGRVDAWEYLATTIGDYPRSPTDLPEVLEAWRYWRAQGQPVFTGAYLVYPQSSTPGTDKLESIVHLTKRLSERAVFAEFLGGADQYTRFRCLERNRGVADFMSMQILTDFGYSTEFRENEFVVAGPGAKRGAAALGMKPDEAIRWAHEAILAGPCPMVFSGEGFERKQRVPSLMDIQNTLCEFSKYVRYRTRLDEGGKPGTLYQPAHKGQQPEPVLPALW